VNNTYVLLLIVSQIVSAVVVGLLLGFLGVSLNVSLICMGLGALFGRILLPTMCGRRTLVLKLSLRTLIDWISSIVLFWVIVFAVNFLSAKPFISAEHLVSATSLFLLVFLAWELEEAEEKAKKPQNPTTALMEKPCCGGAVA